MARNYSFFVLSGLVALFVLPGPTVQAEGTPAVGLSIEQVFPAQKQRKTLPPVVYERTEYYEIKGKSVYDLQCELRDKGCGWSDGKIYDSMTTWEFRWDYDPVRSPSSCTVESFRVSVNIVFRYPKWMQDPSAPQALIEKWDSYMRGLIEHETGHRDTAVAAAEQLSADVDALPAFADCTELDQAIRRLCREHSERLNRKAEEYDETTVHGGEQGAILE